jgi:hypothetical protein
LTKRKQTAFNEGMRSEQLGHPGAGRRPGHVADRLLVGVLGLAVAMTAMAALGTLAWPDPAGSGAPVPPARPDEVLLVLLAWLGVLLAAWLALGSVLAVVSLLPGAGGRAAVTVADRVTPVAVRRLLTLVLGASVGAVALPAPSMASAGPGSVTAPTEPTPGFVPTTDPGPSACVAPSVNPSLAPSVASALPAPTTAMRGPSTRPGPGYVPTAPAPVLDAGCAQLLAPPPRPSTGAHDLVTVRRGDSLWTIAARHLGPTASDAEIASVWPQWYAANRHVIGDDPDLLLPGVQLTPPSAASAWTRAAARGTSR